MATLRAIRRRIASVKKTQQITRAMQMVAAAKFRKAQAAIILARPYAYKMRDVISSLASRAELDLHPLLARRPEKNTEVVIVTSDRGLCAGFNSNILRAASRFVEDLRGDAKRVSLTLIGKKARDYYRRRHVQARAVHIDIFDEVTYHTAALIVDDIIELFSAGETDELYFVYNEFKSAMQQDVVVERLLPFEPEKEQEGPVIDYIYEPSEAAVLDDLLEKHIKVQVFRILLESSASEHAARMTAMDAATNNADDMISFLTLRYNKARQETITKELLDIVGGAEALR
jgi:F-type H+-transporting ATPase subunit gamma